MRKMPIFIGILLVSSLLAQEEECRERRCYRYYQYTPEEERMYRNMTEVSWPSRRDDNFMDQFITH